MKNINLFLTALILFTSAIFAQDVKWSVDKAHSTIAFSVSHMVISEVEGEFHNYEADIVTKGEDFQTVKINIKIDVGSIDTDNEQRDKHLKADDFFNAAEFPNLSFVSKSITKTGDKTYKIKGDFTIRDVTKEIELDAKLNGIIKDPWGNTRAGFKLTGVINRFDYNLKWNTVMETGGLVVGEDVNLIINVEIIKD